jgi:heme exporter protein D
LKAVAHGPFIFGAYAIMAVAMLSLAIWVIADYRAQRRALAELEARGVTRRSEDRQ